MTTATIKDVMFQKEWNGLQIYKLTMDNGQTGDIFTKSWEPKVGEELTYTYDVEKSRMKRVNPNYQGGGNSGGGFKPAYGGGNKGGSKDELIVRQVALKAAVEFAAIHNLKAEHTLQAAEMFNTWINAGKKKEEAPAPPQPAPSQYREQPTPPPAPQMEEDDDLPF